MDSYRGDRTWLYAGLIAVGVGAYLVTRGPRLRRGESLFLFGDSLAEGIAPPLAALCRDNGVKFASATKVGSTVREWMTPGGTLNGKLVAGLAARPTLTLCSLGTNDEYLSIDSARAEIPMLQQLIELVRGSSTLGWIGPPTLPRPGNGFTGVIREHVSRSHYFDSARYQIPRAGDGLHPTVKGYTGWAGQIWLWVF